MEKSQSQQVAHSMIFLHIFLKMTKLQKCRRDYLLRKLGFEVSWICKEGECGYQRATKGIFPVIKQACILVVMLDPQTHI